MAEEKTAKQVNLNDWMVMNTNGNIFKATPDDVKWSESTLEQADFWLPKEGEWCWFWNEFKGRVYMNLGRYSKFIDGKHEGFGINGENYLLCEKVEPFIGELPSPFETK